MAQPIDNVGNHNQNGRHNVVHKARRQWQSKPNGEYNDFHSGGDGGGDHCDREERLAEATVSIASSLDRSLSQINFRLIIS